MHDAGAVGLGHRIQDGPGVGDARAAGVAGPLSWTTTESGMCRWDRCRANSVMVEPQARPSTVPGSSSPSRCSAATRQTCSRRTSSETPAATGTTSAVTPKPRWI
ncbi:hypothetical protein A5N15_08620 [Rothia kristinae]|uniref:Uncharacterized protein n=1 Tax=Rothia kristinae TaxID=37923 RepID=A0A657IVE5_9MICC|nr:hypothetical protein A5N15_08620 [Rothia kristinae]